MGDKSPLTTDSIKLIARFNAFISGLKHKSVWSICLFIFSCLLNTAAALSDKWVLKTVTTLFLFLTVGLLVWLVWAESWRRVIRLSMIIASVAFGCVFLVGTWRWQSTDVTGPLPLPTSTPYPAALLNCVEDVRIGEHRTFRRTYLPGNAVYITEDGSQQIASTDADINDPDGSLYQLVGPYILCTLTNDGDTDLTDVTLTFPALFVRGEFYHPHEKSLIISTQREFLARKAVRAYTVRIRPKSSFEFALINFGSKPCVLGVPLYFGGPTALPTLRYRLGSEGSIESFRSFTTAQETEAALSVAIDPSEKRATPWRVVDKCFRATTSYTHDLRDFTAAARRAMASLPTECKNSHTRFVPMFEAEKH